MQFDNKNIKSIGHNIANSATSHNRTAFIVADGIFMQEIWKDIIGYEGLYQVSNLGRVKSLSRFGSRKVKILKPMLVKTSGYYRVDLKTKQLSIHRLVAIAFIPNPENKREVNHVNSIRTDNRVENLEWTTPSENQLHSYRIGLRIPVNGENNNISKLTRNDVISILNDFKNGITRHELALKFNVSCSAIGRIITNKSWKHIDRTI